MLTFIGDPHGDLNFALQAAQNQQPAALILLGDQCLEEPLDQLLAPFPCPVFYILGNHDSDHPHFLENHFPAWEHNIGLKVTEIAAVRIAALPGVFRGKIWLPEGEPVWRGKHEFLDNMRGGNFKNWLPIKHWTTIFPEDFDCLLGQGTADILVCHETPSCHRNGFQVIDRLAEDLEVDLIVHGHQHVRYQDRLESGIKVVGLGRLGSFAVET
jgi:predicted phosphodiesterase